MSTKDRVVKAIARLVHELSVALMALGLSAFAFMDLTGTIWLLGNAIWVTAIGVIMWIGHLVFDVVTHFDEDNPG